MASNSREYNRNYARTRRFLYRLEHPAKSPGRPRKVKPREPIKREAWDRTSTNENWSATPLVIGFDRPHNVGTVCGYPCEQCGIDREMETTIKGQSDRHTHFLIMAETTEEDWRANCLENGGNPTSKPGPRWYYFVSAD